MDVFAYAWQSLHVKHMLHQNGCPGAAGAFPLWLAPVQARILPVTDAVAGYASEVAAQMRAAGIRVEVASGAPALVSSIPFAKPCMHAQAGILKDAVRGLVDCKPLPEHNRIKCC